MATLAGAERKNSARFLRARAVNGRKYNHASGVTGALDDAGKSCKLSPGGLDIKRAYRSTNLRTSIQTRKTIEHPVLLLLRGHNERFVFSFSRSVCFSWPRFHDAAVSFPRESRLG